MDEQQVAPQLIDPEPHRLPGPQSNSPPGQRKRGQKQDHGQVNRVDPRQAPQPKPPDLWPAPLQHRMGLGQNQPREDEESIDAQIAPAQERMAGGLSELQTEVITENPASKDSPAAREIVNAAGLSRSSSNTLDCRDTLRGDTPTDPQRSQ